MEQKDRFGFRNNSSSEGSTFRLVGFIMKASLLDGPKHGYLIRKWIQEATSGVIILSAATLYENLNKEVQAGNLIRQEISLDELQKHPMRRYNYSLTDIGKESLEKEQALMTVVLNVINSRVCS